MKFSCTKENLHQGLAITSHLGSKAVNLPILNNALLKADSFGLKLTATTIDLTVTCLVRGKVDQQGEYTVPAKLFYDYVNLLPNDRVDIDLLDRALSVVSGSSKTKIVGIPANEFPFIPQVNGGIKFMVPAARLDAALGQVLFAVATNESRPEITGVYMRFAVVDGARMLTLASTDSYRLAECTIPVAEGPEEERQVIMLQRALAELRVIFSVLRDSVDSPENVEIELTDSQVAFRYGNVELVTRTIEGRYPDYRQIIPKNASTEIVVTRQALIQSVKRASLFSKIGLFDVRLEIQPDTKSIVLSANDVERGENTVSLEGEVIGPVNNIVLNYRYLLDGLNAITTEKVALRVVDGFSPCLAVPHESSDKYLYIIMPIRQ